MYTLIYNKRFISGNLTGITVECKINLVDETSIAGWRAFLTSKGPKEDIITRAKWMVKNYSIDKNA